MWLEKTLVIVVTTLAFTGSAFAQNQQWLGTWVSQDGRNSMRISPAKLIYTFSVPEEGGKFSKVTIEQHWSDTGNTQYR